MGAFEVLEGGCGVDVAILVEQNRQSTGLPCFGEFTVAKVTPIYRGRKKYINVELVKIGEKILYRNFVSETAVKTDNLQLYAPLQAINRFSFADITNQQFVDQCVVIVNDNRVQVSLSSGS